MPYTSYLGVFYTLVNFLRADINKYSVILLCFCLQLLGNELYNHHGR